MVDKKHPDYEKYKDKFIKLHSMMNEELSKVELPKIKGLDGPVVAIHKKYAIKISELQKEYSYLFTE